MQKLKIGNNENSDGPDIWQRWVELHWTTCYNSNTKVVTNTSPSSELDMSLKLYLVPRILLSLNFSFQPSIHHQFTIQANTYPRPISCKSSGSHVCLRYLLTILPDKDALKIVLFSASTTLIVFVMITLILFGVLRIFDPARVRRLTQDPFIAENINMCIKKKNSGAW